MSTIEVQRLESSDGHRIRLDVHRGSGATKVVVLAHGIFTNRSEDGTLDALASGLAARGVTAIRFDFRGHGESAWPSSGFSPVGAMKDLHAAVLWCEMSGLELSFVGSSFGASTVLNYLALRPEAKPSAVVLLNPVLDYEATFIRPKTAWGRSLFSAERVATILSTDAARITPHFLAGYDLYAQLSTMRPYETLQSLAARALVFHGDHDDKVPVELTRGHLSAAPVPIDYREMKGAGHGFAEPYGSQVREQTIEWLSES
jgi:uncharacterized protein